MIAYGEVFWSVSAREEPMADNDTLDRLKREDERDRRRRNLAMHVAMHVAHLCPDVSLVVVEAVLQAARETGLRFIERDRILQVHDVLTVPGDIPQHSVATHKDGLRRELATRMGHYLLHNGGLEFEESDREIRGHLYVIFPKPPLSETRDEKS